MNWGITCFFENKNDFKIVEKLAPNYPLKYLEIRGEKPFFSPDDITDTDIDFFNKIIKSANLKVTLHATFYDINLATFNSFLRKATLDCYRSYLDLGEAIGAEILVVHAGYLHRDAAKIEKLFRLAKLYLIENLIDLGDYADKRNIKIGLENSPPNPNHLFVQDWQTHLEILDATNHKNVGAVFDTAHAFLHGLDLTEYYNNIRVYLLELHTHNNNGDDDQHLGISRGKIDYQNFFTKTNIKVPVIMEIRNMEEAIESLEWIKQFQTA